LSRNVAVALTAALVVGVAGACAKPADESRLPIQVVTVADLRAAPDTVASAGSARFEVRFGPEGAEGDLVATGGFAGQRVSVVLDLASVLGRAAEATPGASIPPGPDTTMRVIIDGASVYLQVPMLQGLTGAAGWLSLAPGDLGSMGDSLGVAVDVFDPSKLLEVLREVGADMQIVGAEVVRGVATTHVRGTVSAASGVGSSPDGAIDVWIDRDGLVRRVRMVPDGFPAAMGGAADEVVTIELFDYGEPVEIRVPEASETTPFSNLLGAFAGVGS